MQSITPKSEAIIVSCLSDCEALLELISEDILAKTVPYLFASWFIAFRQLVWCVCDEGAPLHDLFNDFSESEKELLRQYRDLRNAAAHPEAEQRWLNENIMITGAMNFKDNDVQIQYGALQTQLLRNLFPIFENLREKIGIKLSLVSHPAWDMDTTRLNNSRHRLYESLMSKAIEERLRNRMQRNGFETIL